jgi:hypothetical protein
MVIMIISPLHTASSFRISVVAYVSTDRTIACAPIVDFGGSAKVTLHDNGLYEDVSLWISTRMIPDRQQWLSTARNYVCVPTEGDGHPKSERMTDGHLSLSAVASPEMGFGAS